MTAAPPTARPARRSRSTPPVPDHVVPPDLYERDETAWLDLMSAAAAQRRVADLDLPHLSEFLADMAKRDRREVKSRLVVLWMHLLKWDHQPGGRCHSWLSTILEQRRELEGLLDSGTLRVHAGQVLGDAHARARRDAAAETGLPLEAFPETDPRTLDDLLNAELPG